MKLQEFLQLTAGEMKNLHKWLLYKVEEVSPTTRPLQIKKAFLHIKLAELELEEALNSHRSV